MSITSSACATPPARRRRSSDRSAGMIHKAMFERLILSEYAIADLTILNANVYYELGVRHAARPQTTVLRSERRDDPQGDVRAPDPLRIRHRGSDHPQRQCLLRARRAPRRPPADDGPQIGAPG